MDRFVVISGCSSGGKSTLIAELGRRGYAVVDEPGRRIVKEELARGGSALPWVDGVAFARRAMEIALADRAAAGSLDGWVFFDRGLIDAATALEHMTCKPVLTALGQANRYHRRMFLAPPWLEIYETEPERFQFLERDRALHSGPSTLEGGKTAAKSVMAAVAAHREEFEFDRHCSGPNLDATPNDIIRRIERDSALIDLVALMGNYAATAAFGSIAHCFRYAARCEPGTTSAAPTQFRRMDNPKERRL